MKQDRRVGRTRQSLHQALLSLTTERGYDAVTVQDVLDRAQIARSTFYAHFRDKDDLLLAGFEEMQGSLPGTLFAIAPENRAGNPEFGIALFRHVYEHRELAKAFLRAGGGTMAYQNLRNILVVETRSWLANSGGAVGQGVPAEIVVQYVVSSLFGLLTWWVDHDFPHTPDAMGAYCQELILSGLGESR